jgi:hypothetical protein
MDGRECQYLGALAAGAWLPIWASRSEAPRPIRSSMLAGSSSRSPSLEGAWSRGQGVACMVQGAGFRVQQWDKRDPVEGGYDSGLGLRVEGLWLSH